MDKRQVQNIKPLLEVKIPESVILKNEFKEAKENGLVVLEYNNVRYCKFHQINEDALMALENMRPVKSKGGFRYFGNIDCFESNRGLVNFVTNGNKEKAYFNKCDVFIDGENIDMDLPFHNFMYNSMPVEIYISSTTFSPSEGRPAKYKAEYVGCHPVYFGVVETVYGFMGYIRFLKERSHEKAFFHKDIICVNGKKSDIMFVDEVIKKNSPVLLVVQYSKGVTTDANYKAYFVSPLPLWRNEDILRSLPTQINLPLSVNTLGSASKQLYYVTGLTGLISRYLSQDTGIVQAFIRNKRYDLQFTLNVVKVPPSLAMVPLQDSIPCNTRVYFDAYIYSDKRQHKVSSLWLGKKTDCISICKNVDRTVKKDSTPAKNREPIIKFQPPMRNSAFMPPISPAAVETSTSPLVDSFSGVVKKVVSLPVTSKCINNTKAISAVAHTVQNSPAEKNISNVQCLATDSNVQSTTLRSLSQQLGKVESFISNDTGVICYNYCGQNVLLIFHKDVVSFPICKSKMNLKDYLKVGQKVYFNGNFSRSNIVSSFVFTKVWPLRESAILECNNYSGNQMEDSSISDLAVSPIMPTKVVQTSGTVNTHLTRITSYEKNEDGNIVMVKRKHILNGIIKYCVEDTGILVRSSEELTFSRKASNLYGIPLQKYSLQDIFKQGDEVCYTRDPNSGVKKMWFGCEAHDAKLFFQDLVKFCKTRNLSLSLTNELIQDFSRLYLVKEDQNANHFQASDGDMGACEGKSTDTFQSTHNENMHKYISSSGTEYYSNSVDFKSLTNKNGDIKSITSDDSYEDTSISQSSREHDSVSFKSDSPYNSTEKSSSSDNTGKNSPDNHTKINGPISKISTSNKSCINSAKKDIFLSPYKISIDDDNKQPSSPTGSFIWDNKFANFNGYEQVTGFHGNLFKRHTPDSNESSAVANVSENHTSDMDLSSLVYFSDDESLDDVDNLEHEDNFSVDSLTERKGGFTYTKESEKPFCLVSAEPNSNIKEKVSATKKQEYELKYYEESDNNKYDSELQESNNSCLIQVISNNKSVKKELETFQIQLTEDSHSDDHSDNASCSLLGKNEGQLEVTYAKSEEKLHESAVNISTLQLANTEKSVQETTRNITFQIICPDFTNALKNFLGTKLLEQRFRNLPHLHVDKFIKRIECRFYDVICEELKDSLTLQSESMSSYKTVTANENELYNINNTGADHAVNVELANEIVQDFRESVLQELGSVLMCSESNRPVKQVTSIDVQTVSTGDILHSQLLFD